jgi:hypothetical protein
MRLRRTLLAFTLAAALVVGAAPAALASTSPGDGPAFGQHVSGMTPEAPLAHGSHFGECVSGMATGTCPHGH